jgi:DNA polymerase-3 subunit gamma/tau
LAAQYADGADPVAVLRDLAEITHWLSVVKITPDAAEDPTIGAGERARGQELAAASADARADADVADAPEGAGGGAARPQRDDGRRDGDHPPDPCGRPADARRSGEEADRGAALRPVGPVRAPGAASSAPVARDRPRRRATGGPTASGAQTALQQRAPGPDLARYPTWDSVVALVEDTRDMKLLVEVKSCLRLVSYAPGRIEVEPTENAPATS